MNAPPRVPLGTQVVVVGEAAHTAGGGIGRGIAGRIVRDTGGSYTVALADGRLVEAADGQLMTVGDGFVPPPTAHQVPSARELVTEHTVLAAEVGHPFGGFRPAAVRGVYQAPTAALWSLARQPEQVTGPGEGWLSWEVETFCRLALEGDPACHELLWSSRTMWVSETGRELQELRVAFLSQAIAPRYATAVLEQFKELEQGDHGDERWALATDPLRYLLAGAALLRTGDAAGSLVEHDEQLTQVRAGQLPWEQVEAWRMELQQRLEEAAAATFLPAEPDAARVQTWLSDLRRRDLDAST